MRDLKDILYKVSAILILASAVLFLSLPQIASWIMIGSVVLFTGITLSSPYPGKSIRGKRLFNMQVLSCVMMLVASYLMYISNNIWALAMLVATILLLYSSIFISKELKKEGIDQ